MEGTGRFWQAAPPAAWTVTVVNPVSDDTPPVGRDAAVAGPDADDGALVDACLAGNREAFDRLVTRHQRMVYRVCYRFLGNHEDASDAAQDTFVRAYRGLATFRGGSSFSTWLYRIAVNASLNRRSGRRTDLDPLEPARHVAADAESPEDALRREEQRSRVRAAIARLPARQRAALILRTYHDLTHEQIAKVMGGSVGTSKANFFHALRNLKALLGSGEPR